MPSIIILILSFGLVFCTAFPENVEQPCQDLLEMIRDIKERNDLILRILFNSVDKDGRTPLHFAISKGDEKLAEDLIKHGADVNAQNDANGMTPLQVAVTIGDENMVDMLTNNANTKVTYQNGKNIIFDAVASGRDKVLEFLLNKGIDIVPDNDGETPLHSAASTDNVVMTEKLIKLGVNVNATDSHRRTSLHFAVINGSEKVVGVLLKNGIDVNATDDTGSTALHRAAEKGYTTIAEEVIKSGIDIDHVDSQGCTALHRSAEHGTVAVTAVLIENEAQPNIRDNIGLTPWNWARKSEHVDEFTKLLSEHGMKAVKDSIVVDNRLLFKAIIDGNVEKVQALIKNVDINRVIVVRPLEYTNPEFAALFYDHLDELTEVLSEHGRIAANDSTEVKYFELMQAIVKGNFTNLAAQRLKKYVEMNLSSNVRPYEYPYYLDEWTPLIAAAFHGQKKIVELLIENEANVNLSIKEGLTPIRCAIRKAEDDFSNFGNKTLEERMRDDFDIFVLLLKNGANFNESLILKIAYAGNENMMDYLINNGVNVDSVDDKGFTTLMTLSQRGDGKAVEFLIKKGANVNYVAPDGNSILMVTMNKLNVFPQSYQRIVKVLVKNGANVNCKSSTGDTPLTRAAQEVPELIEVFLKAGANVSAVNGNGQTALNVLAARVHRKTAEMLLKNGADVNAMAKDGRTPLMDAAKNRKGYLVELLIENGANVNSVDKKGRTPLADAIQGENVEITNMIIENGADLNYKHPEVLELALIKRRFSGDDELIRLIINKGAQVDKEIASKISEWALKRKNENVIKLMMEKGINLDGTYGNGQTALHVAVSKGYQNLAKKLIKYGVNINATDSKQKTPLLIALSKGDDNLIDLLIDSGAQINSENESQLLRWAIKEDKKNVINLMIKKGVDTSGLIDGGLVDKENSEIASGLPDDNINDVDGSDEDYTYLDTF